MDDDSVSCPMCNGTGNRRDEEIGTDYDCFMCQGEATFTNEWFLVARVIEMVRETRREQKGKDERYRWEYDRERKDMSNG